MSSPEPQQTLLHYRLLEKIGSGGMGEVYKAEDTKLGRTVAIKLLSATINDNVTAKRRFLKEAQAASALNHPEQTRMLGKLLREARDSRPRSLHAYRCS